VIGFKPDGSCASDPEEQFTDLFEGIGVVLTEAGIALGLPWESSRFWQG